MTNPGDAFPTGDDWIVRKLKGLQDQITALASARSLQSASEGASGSNFAVGTVSSVVCSTTVLVPPGYATALIMCVNQVDIFNSTGSSLFVYSNVGINGIGGAESDGSAPAGTAITITPAAIRSMDVAGMTSFTIDCRVRAQSVIGASGGNVATVNAIVLFLR